MLENNGIIPTFPVNNNGNDCNNMWIWMIAIFALLGGGNFFNRSNNAATQAEVQAGFNNQDVMNQLRGITYGLSSTSYENARGQNTLEKTVMQGDSVIGGQVSTGFCNIERVIDNLKAEGYKNTCEIVNAIHSEAEKTRTLITDNTIQNLRDKLAEKDRELSTSQFNLSQVMQSAGLVSALKPPMPIPAYVVANPFASGTTTATTT